MIKTLNIKNAVLFVCDLQERFRPLIHNYGSILTNTRFMMDCSAAMNIPIVVTEHCPKIFGRTVSELGISESSPPNCNVISKEEFSMVPSVKEALRSQIFNGEKKQVFCYISSA